MPVRIQVPTRTPKAKPKKPVTRTKGFVGKVQFILALPAVRYSLLGVLALVVIVATWTALEYRKYARLADEKLLSGPFPNSSLLYAAPQIVGVGDSGTPASFAVRLRESGYLEDGRRSSNGWFHLRSDAIEIFPGEQASNRIEPAVLKFGRDGRIQSIISLTDNTARTQYAMEPRLLSSMFDRNREKRRLVRYNDIPPVLVHAVISIEDKRFFQHGGFDPLRILKAMWVDVKTRRNAQGASTITQQLARNIWLDSRKTLGRKFDELLITIHLEQKLTKEKIFEYYANQVDLGRRGSFAIRGFGEASQAYFGKNLRSLTLPEAATLAGLIQQPSRFNPVRYPDRAQARRNVVLRQMRENGWISDVEYQNGLATPVNATHGSVESADAPYFVDLVNERLAADFSDQDFQESGSHIYTTVDPDLQRDATEAVAFGMAEIAKIVAKRPQGGSTQEPQVALICMDPHTGEVKALIGGRNYGASQLNHVVAKRPAGSTFKPFVYAAALNTGLQDRPDPLTPATVVKDEPRAFIYGGKSYEPTDYHNAQGLGDVTLRTALAKSLNIPAVEVAEMVGYNTVASLARKAGLHDIGATPAAALGAYDVTPLEMITAYSMFANNGSTVQPRFISDIVDRSGGNVWSSKPTTDKVLDPRVNFLIVNMMGEVLRTGTGASARSRGFTLPAAGKTGTEHDAWFAGFTTRLLCVVWVGLDNYDDLKIDGAKAALPIWTEFMRRAHKHRAYRDVSDFQPPDGLVSTQIDSLTGQLATSSCPPAQIRNEYFLLGTQPVAFCPLHSGEATQIAGWDSTSRPPATLPNLSGPIAPAIGPDGQPLPDTQAAKDADKQKKKGLFDKLRSIFK